MKKSMGGWLSWSVAALGVAALGLGILPAKKASAESRSEAMGNVKTETATFAGGCFWCIEAAFDDVDGVVKAVSGYSGGHDPKPTYEKVCDGGTGHLEAVQVTYDPAKISYEALLQIFWHQIDPTDPDGQFADRGEQYHTAIFYHNAAQKRIAEASKARLAASGKFKDPIVTDIREFQAFYPAEEHHQKYCKLHPVRYSAYKHGSGRAGYIDKTWAKEPLPVIKISEENDGVDHGKPAGAAPAAAPKGKDFTRFVKPSDEELHKRLTPLQYEVTQKSGTERPFANDFWDNHKDGIYVDVVSGEPLFSSKDKFNSGTGWPSFSRPLEPDNLAKLSDHSYGMDRDEIRSAHANSHLGHLFSDGPAPTGLRYCINSASLRFVPKEKLEAEGYGQYKGLFDSARQAAK